MRILLADSNHEVLEEMLTAADHRCTRAWDEPLTTVLEMLSSHHALVIRSRFKITQEVLESAPLLRCIGRVGAGMENIDVAFATKKGIACVCAPEGNRDAVGEHALGMLLMLLHNLRRADAEVRTGVWRRAENRGYELNAMTVAIIGFGNMGSAFAAKLAGMGCKVLAYDKYKSGYGTSAVKETKMEEIFAEADVVSLHLPLTEETTHLVNAAYLAKFRKPVYLVNTARGFCVNTADLVQAIKDGRVRGACLDVLEYEKTSFEGLATSEMPTPMQFLVGSDKVVLSPHIAGWTHESNYKMSRLIAERMIAALKS